MARIVAAGHICLDIIPEFSEGTGELGALMTPGTLTEVGPAVVSTGGAVPNTGQALFRLGEEVVLTGKVGDDEFGHTVRRLLNRTKSGLADGLIVDTDSTTSYSVVINPPGVDRIFLHSPGANHTFGADDVDFEKLQGCELFHFGYPPLMKRIYAQDGVELKTLFQRAKDSGMTTSLDMTFVDPSSLAGQVDWRAFLKNVLPVTDIFLPSLDEILFMTDREKYDQLVTECDGRIIDGMDAAQIEQTAQKLIDYGVPVVVIKLGKNGLYLKTAGDVPGKDEGWNNVSCFEPCFSAEVVGTTGAGDCSIAGFLSATVNGASAKEAVTMAVAAGSASTESLNATDAVPTRTELQKRIREDWPRDPGRFCQQF